MAVSSGSSSSDLGDHSEEASNGSSTEKRLPKIKIKNGNLTKSNLVSRTSSTIFKRKIHPDGITWGDVPESHKLLYFEELKKLIHWNRTKDAKVYDIWSRRSRHLYNDMLYKARQVGRRPEFMSEAIWTAWNIRWSSEEFKKKSRTARKNRMSEPGGPGTGISIHRGGTRSASDHALHLAEQGCEEDEIPFAVYNILHCKGGVYDNGKAAAVAEEYTKKVAEMSQSLSDGSQPVNTDKAKILFDAAGGVSGRGCLYGFGSQVNSFKASSSKSSHTPYDSDSAQLKRKVAELEEKLRESQTEAAESKAQLTEQQATLQATVQAHEAQMQQFKAMLEQLMNGSKSTPP